MWCWEGWEVEGWTGIGVGCREYTGVELGTTLE